MCFILTDKKYREFHHKRTLFPRKEMTRCVVVNAEIARKHFKYAVAFFEESALNLSSCNNLHDLIDESDSLVRSVETDSVLTNVH